MANKNGNGALRLYKSYMFKSKDPVIDELRTIFEDHFGARVNHHNMKEVEENGGPSVSCMVGWWKGETKRPTSATVEAAGRAMGFQRVWRRMRANAE